MELEDVRSDLHALKKLYGLLQSSEESLLSASSVNLDDNEKLFLKNLLDRATEMVFDTHSKIIAAQSSISNKPCSTPPEQSDATIKLQPPASRNISKASPSTYVQGLRVSPSQVKLGQECTFIAKMPSPMPQNETTGNLTTSTPSLIPRSLDPNMDFVLPNRKGQAVRPRHKMNKTQMVQPNLYDERTEDQKVRGIHKNIHVGPQSRIVRRPQISEETSSSSGSSSSWTSSSSQLSGSASRRSGRVASFSSSGESASFSHGRGSNYRTVGSSRREYAKKEFRTEGRMNPEKQTGRLRRLKNKLGLVFHHHRHYHHHNHNNDDDDDSDRAEAAHAMSLWTHMRKILPHSTKKKVYDDHSVKKSRKKAVVSNVPSKNQHGQFHSIAEGLMRHVRHSKKSKHSKGGIGRLGNDQHGHNKKVVKKLHWWKMLTRKRGVKSKGRVKLGYTSKKKNQLRGAKKR